MSQSHKVGSPPSEFSRSEQKLSPKHHTLSKSRSPSTSCSTSTRWWPIHHCSHHALSHIVLAKFRIRNNNSIKELDSIAVIAGRLSHMASILKVVEMIVVIHGDDHGPIFGQLATATRTGLSTLSYFLLARESVVMISPSWNSRQAHQKLYP